MTRMVSVVLLSVVVLLFAVALSLSAFANPPVPTLKPHMHDDEAADVDWYSDLGAGQGVDCCADQHCQRSSYCSDTSFGEGVVVDDVCVRLPYDKIVAPPVGVLLGPDEVHVCAYSGKIRCVTGSGQV